MKPEPGGEGEKLSPNNMVEFLNTAEPHLTWMASGHPPADPAARERVWASPCPSPPPNAKWHIRMKANLRWNLTSCMIIY